MKLRPHVREFLQAMGKIYEVRVNLSSSDIKFNCLVVPWSSCLPEKCSIHSMCIQRIGDKFFVYFLQIVIIEE